MTAAAAVWDEQGVGSPCGWSPGARGGRVLERTERLRPESDEGDWSTCLSELTPNSAKIAYVLVAISSARINKAVSSKAVAATAAPRAASVPRKARRRLVGAGSALFCG